MIAIITPPIITGCKGLLRYAQGVKFAAFHGLRVVLLSWGLLGAFVMAGALPAALRVL